MAVNASHPDRELLLLIASAKEQHVNMTRSTIIDQLSATMPDTNITVEKFTTAVIKYVNGVADGQIISPLFNSTGPQIANLDSDGTSQALQSSAWPSC